MRILSFSGKRVSKKTGDNDMRKEKEKRENHYNSGSCYIYTCSCLVLFMVGKVIMSQMNQNNKEFVVDNYVGKNYQEVVRMLEDNNIRVKLVEKYNDECSRRGDFLPG